MQRRELRTRKNDGRKDRSPRPVAVGRCRKRARLSHLIEEALAGRPQHISRRGAEVAVLVSAAEYDRMMTPGESLVEFFGKSPLAEAVAEGELDLERDPDAIRDITW